MAKMLKEKADRRKAPVKKSADTAPPVTLSVTEEAIAQRAFEVYCARGGEHGDAVGDWLQAERELASQAS